MDDIYSSSLLKDLESANTEMYIITGFSCSLRTLEVYILSVCVMIT